MLNEEFESELARVRDALTGAVAVQIQFKNKIAHHQEELATWEKRIGSAHSSGHEDLVAPAQEKIAALKKLATELDIERMAQDDVVEGIRKDLARLENRRYTAGGDNGREALAHADSNVGAMSRFEHKIVEQEALVEASHQLANHGVDERKLAADEAAHAIDDELAALKAAVKKKES